MKHLKTEPRAKPSLHGIKNNYYSLFFHHLGCVRKEDRKAELCVQQKILFSKVETGHLKECTSGRLLGTDDPKTEMKCKVK
jgi:hypothetical protein